MIRTRLLALVLLSLGLAACGGATRFSSTWVDPAAGPTDWPGQKVVAFVLSARDSIRLGAEESLARELTSRGALGVAGHTLVPKDVTEDQDKVRELLSSAGVVGAVVMRVVSQTQQISSSPGTVWYTGSYLPVFLRLLGLRVERYVSARTSPIRHHRLDRNSPLLGRRRQASLGGSKQNHQP